MVKKLFENFWIKFGLMMLCAIADLVGLTVYYGEQAEMTKIAMTEKATHSLNIGFGFIIAFAYFLWWTIRQMTVKDKK
jgi:hypothetical protein